MKRVLVIAATMALLVIGLVPLALAATQPRQGVHSTGRNEAGFGQGPHCHVLIDPGAQEQFTIVVYPSHQGHASSGVGHVFAADLDCNGVAG